MGVPPYTGGTPKGLLIGVCVCTYVSACAHTCAHLYLSITNANNMSHMCCHICVTFTTRSHNAVTYTWSHSTPQDQRIKEREYSRAEGPKSDQKGSKLTHFSLLKTHFPSAPFGGSISKPFLNSEDMAPGGSKRGPKTGPKRGPKSYKVT